jgi:hypothetical protein
VRAKTALATLTKLAQANWAKGSWSLQLRASTTIGLSVSNIDGTTAFLYQRPNGKLGQINVSPLDMVA